VLLTQKAFITNNEGKILTVFRTETAPARPLTWDFPGGEVDAGEDFVEAIEREIREEVGLEVEDIEPFTVVSDFKDNGEFIVTIAYKAKTKSGDVTLSYEHSEYKWLTREELADLIKFERFLKILEKF